MIDFAPAVAAFVTILERLKLDYYIGGSLVSIMFGEVRVTRDVDFIVSISSERVPDLVAALQHGFYADDVAAERSVRTGDCFNAIHFNSGFQVDIFTPLPNEWTQTQMSRRLKRTLEFAPAPIDVYVASPEDTVINKLIWFQMGSGASSVQWRDVLGVLKRRGDTLDWHYIRGWAREHRVEHLLDRARAEAGINV